MSCQLTLTGQLLVNPDSCGGGCGSGTSPVTMSAKALALACSNGLYQEISSTSCPVQVSTPGLLGAAYVDLPGADIDSISLLYVKTDMPVRLRLNGAEPELVSTATFPVTPASPETLDLEIDGFAFATTFAASAYTAAAAAALINSRATLAGLSYLPASITAGQLVIKGNQTGSSSYVAVVAGAATLGLATNAEVFGSGADVGVQGLFLAQFSPVITRVQVSGTARVDVLAAG